MNLPVPYTDRDSYDDLMSLSMPDKLFFLKSFQADHYVDFGCGTGEMLALIGKAYPDAKLWGFDNDAGVLRVAENRKLKNSAFYIEFEGLMEEMLSEHNSGEKICFILSSVLHEMISYKPLTEVFRIWDQIKNSGADYIVIRDMAISRLMYPETVDVDLQEKVYKIADTQQLKEFTNVWGEINRVPAFVHYLLKYKYKVNWKRELVENYLACFVEDIESEFGEKSGYECVMKHHYTLPFLKVQIKKEFGFDLKYPTHIKLIYRKKQL